MNKTVLNKPVLICLYGYPGSGKSYLARHLEEELPLARVSADRIRHELFAHPRYDAQENAIIAHLMNYMSEEFLKSGVSVVYDTNAMRIAQRRRLREIAKHHKAEYVLVWLQVDIENAFLRTQRRDRRTQDDKYSEEQTKESFNHQISAMQNPEANENYLVVSGKHSFISQRSALLNRFYQIGAVSGHTVQSNIAAPGLVNLVPNPHAGRVDFSRRNINIT